MIVQLKRFSFFLLQAVSRGFEDRRYRMQGISSSFADFAINTHYDNLEPQVIHQTKKLILDLGEKPYFIRV